MFICFLIQERRSILRSAVAIVAMVSVADYYFVESVAAVAAVAAADGEAVAVVVGAVAAGQVLHPSTAAELEGWPIDHCSEHRQVPAEHTVETGYSFVAVHLHDNLCLHDIVPALAWESVVQSY